MVMLKTEENMGKEKTLQELLAGGQSVTGICERKGMSTRAVVAELKDELLGIVSGRLGEGVGCSELASQLGLNYETVRRWIHRYNLTEKWKANKSHRLEEKQEIWVIASYLRLMSLTEITKEFKVGSCRVGGIIQAHGIPVFNSGEMKRLRNAAEDFWWRPLSPHLAEVLVGELLGDGYMNTNLDGLKEKTPERTPSLEQYRKAVRFIQALRERKKNSFSEVEKQTFLNSTRVMLDFPAARFILTHSRDQADWCRFVGKIFTNHNYPVTYRKRKRTFQWKGRGEKQQKTVWSTTVFSTTSVQLFKLYQMWYPPPYNQKVSYIKRIPQDINITPTVLLHWFVGDGSHNRSNITLHTNGFKEEDVSMLSNKLSQAGGIRTYVVHKKDRNYPDSTYPVLTVGRSDVDAFYSYLNQAREEELSMARKVVPWKFDLSLRRKDFRT